MYDILLACFQTHSHSCTIFIIEILWYFCLQVVGIKGATVLSLHRPYDISKGIAVDDLHAVFLGVTLDLLRFWLKHRTEIFSLRSQVCSHVKSLTLNYMIMLQIAQCNEILLRIQVPDTIQEPLDLCLSLRNGRVSFAYDYFPYPSL